MRNPKRNVFYIFLYQNNEKPQKYDPVSQNNEKSSQNYDSI